MKKLQNILLRTTALLLALMMIFTTVPMIPARAEEIVEQDTVITFDSETTENLDALPSVEEPEDTKDMKETKPVEIVEEVKPPISEETKIELFGEEDPSIRVEVDETSIPDNQVAYIYIESPYLESGQEQNIIVSLDGETDNLKDATLTYQHINGKKYTVPFVIEEGGAFLFSKEFTQAEQGIYELTAIQAVKDGEIIEYKFADAGITAIFGVDEEYVGTEKSETIDMGDLDEINAVETSIVSLNPENTQSEEFAEQAIADAIDVSTTRAGEIGSGLAGASTFSGGNKDLVIVLDPGHCRSHPGASGNGINEHEAVLEIAKACRDYLKRYSGIQVYMTRETAVCPFPETVGPRDGSTQDIYKRVAWAHSKKADVLISFHLNASPASGANGAEVFYRSTNATGRGLAQEVQNALVALGLTNRGIKTENNNGNFIITREAEKLGFPGILIEHGFVSNVADARNYFTAAGLKRLGEADAKAIAKYYGLTEGRWEQDSRGWKYKRSNGTYIQSAWETIAGRRYYFNTNGYRVTGWQTLSGKRYYFMPDGHMWTGWGSFGGTKYYFMADGHMWTGWGSFNGRRHYFGNDGKMLVGWQTIDGKRYYFMPDGVMWTGWGAFGSTRYYFMPDGHMWTGWGSFGNRRHYFATNGRMLTGWQTIDEKTYYFMPDGVMWRGWGSFGSTRYYFDNNGVMAVGQRVINGTTYIFSARGILQETNGWRIAGEKKYYYRNGKTVTGWQTIEGNRYYFMPDGHMWTGWGSFGNTRYYFDSEGKMLTGWQSIAGKRYYFMPNGHMWRGWGSFAGRRYYFMPDGHMWTGWGSFGSKRYYFRETDGLMLTGIQVINGVTYQFYSNGELRNNYRIAGTSSVTAEQLARYFRSSGNTYPAFYANSDAPTLEEFCRMYVEEAHIEGIKVEIAFAQAMLETGWLRFGGDVQIGQYNFAGIGAIGGGAGGNHFTSVRQGIRGQIHHLKAYANMEPLKRANESPRFHLVTRGSAPFVEWLGIQENPAGKGWATSPGYGVRIMLMVDVLKSK